MKNSFRFLGPLTFLCGLIIISLSLTRPATAQPQATTHGFWVALDTQPTFPPGVNPLIQNVVGYLNKNGGADAAVYVPELHRLFAHYSR